MSTTTSATSSDQVLHGSLTAAAPIPAAIKHHIAIGSIDATITGGAQAVLTVSKTNAAKIVGLLPDGHAISAATTANTR